MSEFLVLYLDSIDERLLDYLDDDEELRLDVVKRLRFDASALFDGSITASAVAEDWEDWFDLVGAFVAAYASDEVAELEEVATFIEDEDGSDTLTGQDRAYLGAVVPLLDSYPEMRMDVGA